MSNMKLKKASLRKARFFQTILNGADMTGADLTEAIRQLVAFSGCPFYDGATFHGAKVEKNSFLHTSLKKTDFTEAELVKAAFLEAERDRRDLPGCPTVQGAIAELQPFGAEFPRDVPFSR